MSFWQKMKSAMMNFMQGRHGADNLGMFTLILGLILSLAATFTGNGILSILGLGLYAWTLFRMLSRNNEARIKENRKYIELTSGWKTRGNQWVLRMKNRKDYVYFKCPDCKVLLRAKRGGGEKDIVCPRCSTKFKRKT